MPTGALLTPPSHNEYDEDAYGKLYQDVHEALELEVTRKKLEDTYDHS